MLIKHLNVKFSWKIVFDDKFTAFSSDSQFVALQRHLEWQDFTKASWDSRDMEISVSFKEIYVISECHEHPCCHLFSVPLHFFQDISCRKFSNSLFLTQPESAKYQYFWWQLSVKLYDYLACISLKIVSCLLTWHVHFFAYIFKRELY